MVTMTFDMPDTFTPEVMERIRGRIMTEIRAERQREYTWQMGRADDRQRGYLPGCNCESCQRAAAQHRGYLTVADDPRYVAVSGDNSPEPTRRMGIFAGFDFSPARRQMEGEWTQPVVTGEQVTVPELPRFEFEPFPVDMTSFYRADMEYITRGDGQIVAIG